MVPPYPNVGAESLLPRLPGGGGMVALSSPHSLVGGGVGGGGSIGAPRDMIMTSKMAQTDINMENMDQLVTNAATSGGFLRLGISFCLLG